MSFAMATDTLDVCKNECYVKFNVPNICSDPSEKLDMVKAEYKLAASQSLTFNVQHGVGLRIKP